MSYQERKSPDSPGAEDAPKEALPAVEDAGTARRLAAWGLAALSVGLALASVALWLAQRPAPGRMEVLIPTPAPVVVHVSGAVLFPGAYELPVGSRVIDALHAAGGSAPAADLSRFNLAARVVDGSHLAVPELEGAAREMLDGGEAGSNEAADRPAAESPAGAANGSPVDLNTGTESELMTLPGIGEKRATQIIDFRERNGPITSVDDLLQIPGIGPGTVDLIRPHVAVGP